MVMQTSAQYLFEEDDTNSFGVDRESKEYQFYRQLRGVDWKATDINPAEDLKDWGKLSDAERRWVKKCLAFFNCADRLVADNDSEFFSQQIPNRGVQLFYRGAKVPNEEEHAETYENFILTYIPDKRERDTLLNATVHDPTIRRKFNWLNRWMLDEKAPLIYRLWAFTCGEGISFSGSFSGILFFDSKRKLPELSRSNRYIRRDEGIHVRFGEHLVRTLLWDPDNAKERADHIQQIRKMAHEACELEIEFIRSFWSDIPADETPVPVEDLTDYVRFITNRSLHAIGIEEPLYPEAPKSCPLPWMTLYFSSNVKGNFLETPGAEYQSPKPTRGKLKLLETF